MTGIWLTRDLIDGRAHNCVGIWEVGKPWYCGVRSDGDLWADGPFKDGMEPISLSLIECCCVLGYCVKAGEMVRLNKCQTVRLVSVLIDILRSENPDA